MNNAWKEYITTELNSLDTKKFRFRTPASNNLFFNLKKEFQLVELPIEFEEMYKRTDGIQELLEGKVIGEFIWSIEKIIKENKEYRTNPDFKNLYMSFEQLLFISDAGNGDLFGFVTLNGRIDRFDIFTWNHENDSRMWVAPNLTTFIKWWINGTINV